MAIQDDLLRLLQTDPTFRDAARRELFGPELLAVPAHLEAIAAAQQRTGEWMEQIVAAQARTDEHLASLTARVDRLAAAQEETVQRLDRLVDWQRGEEGRREGERYERNTVRHAAALFGGGRDATRRLEDLERLQQAIAGVSADAGLKESDDPFLADLLWWKGERLAVVEISRQVDPSDMERAERRAATLRSAGLPAFGVVIGRDWASEEAERTAYSRSIEWRVGEDASTGYVEFRRAPAA